jgi:hypothetical protein
MMFEKKAKKVLKGRREIPCSCPDCGGVQWYDITPLLDKDITLRTFCQKCGKYYRIGCETPVNDHTVVYLFTDNMECLAMREFDLMEGKWV